MEPSKFIEPKRIKIGNSQFVISKIPAIQAQQVYGTIMKECKDEGDIAMTYLSENACLALLSYAAFDRDEDGTDTNLIPLNATEAINVYCGNVTTLINLEAAMIRYNFGFLFDGSLQKVLGVLRDEEAV